MATKSTKARKSTKVTRSATKSTRSQTSSTPKPAKPVFRAGTWIALVLFAAIVGTALYMNRQAEEKASATETPAADQSFVFDGSKTVTSIKVESADGGSAGVKRNSDQTWVLSLPEEAEADQGAAEAAASQVSALSVVTEIEGQKDPSIFGLDKPAFTITVGFDGGTSSTLKVGDQTPSKNGYYVQTDDGKIHVVALSGIDALTGMVAIPPYLNTPTPVPTETSTPLPTETPVSTTDTSATPQATPTP